MMSSVKANRMWRNQGKQNPENDKVALRAQKSYLRKYIGVLVMKDGARKMLKSARNTKRWKEYPTDMLHQEKESESCVSCSSSSSSAVAF